MITLKEIMEDYGMPIEKSIRDDINKYISLPIIQEYVRKALNYNLTDEDTREIYRIGNCKGEYPRLYYLCLIYIHPLTRASYCLTEYEKIIR